VSYTSICEVFGERLPIATILEPSVTGLVVFMVVAAMIFGWFVYRPMHQELVFRRHWVVPCNMPGCSHLAEARLWRESELPNGGFVCWRDVCPCHVEWGEQNLVVTEKRYRASLLSLG
jgi:hypothetical protein